MIRILVFGMLLLIAIPNASSVVSEKLQPKSGKHISFGKQVKSNHLDNNEAQNQNKEDAQQLNKLAENAQSYKDNPSNETYTELWQHFVSWVRQLAAKHIDASNLCKSCQVLSKAGLKIIDVAGSGGTVKIYTFSPQAIWTQVKPNSSGPQNNPKSELKPLVASNIKTTIESRDFLVQSTDTELSESSSRFTKHSLHGKTKRSRLRAIRARKTTILRTQSITMPTNIEIKQASLLSGSVSKSQFLAILGSDLQSGHFWTEGLKRTGISWTEDTGLWQQVPSFLLQQGQVKLRLSENNLVITLGGHGSADNSSTTGGYELVMPFVENHFALTRNEAQDPARAIALQFLLAVQVKRPDLVKIWLADPQLASIPGYLGLYGPGSFALKLINMAASLNGCVRFRLITNTKDDLIVDVAKVKGQWLVKSLYIASADSLARELGRILPADTNK